MGSLVSSFLGDAFRLVSVLNQQNYRLWSALSLVLGLPEQLWLPGAGSRSKVTCEYWKNQNSASQVHTMMRAGSDSGVAGLPEIITASAGGRSSQDGGVYAPCLQRSVPHPRGVDGGWMLS